MKVEVNSLWMLFANLYDAPLQLLQKVLEVAEKARKSTDLMALIDHYLRDSIPALRTMMGLPAASGDRPRPLWIVLQKRASCELAAVPYFPHYVPDEPWMYLKDAMVTVSNSTQLQGSQLDVKNLLSKCFNAMRNNIDDMLPWGWDLADNQSLAGVDITQLDAKEDEHFVCLGLNVFSKEFAIKSQAMKDLSTLKVYKLNINKLVAE